VSKFTKSVVFDKGSGVVSTRVLVDDDDTIFTDETVWGVDMSKDGWEVAFAAGLEWAKECVITDPVNETSFSFDYTRFAKRLIKDGVL